ncbi:MAG: hypothetical protein ACRD0L_01950 [Acidimicrobiales bacterium]
MGRVLQGLRRAVALAAVAVAGAACTGTAGPASVRTSTTVASPATVASPTTVVPGCGSTPLRRGHPPSWTASAHPPTELRYALSEEGNAVGFLFSDPLVAGTSNKILWVVRQPRGGQPLHVTAHPVGSSRPVVTMSFPDDSSPGFIYPSIDDVPSPGCWQFTLTWNGSRATLDLPYVSA